MYRIRSPTSPAGTMATAPLAAITYRKEARVLQYEQQLYAGLGRFYLGGAPAAARADWAARRAWTMQRAGVGAAPLAEALARLARRDEWPPAPAPEDEREARGNRAVGRAIQEARRGFGRELSHDDVRLMQDLGYTLDEIVAYLEQFDDDDDDDNDAAAAARPGLKVYSDAELEEQGYRVHAPGRSPDVAAGAREPRTVPDDDSGGAVATAWMPTTESEDGLPTPHRAGRFDPPAAYRHLVSPLDGPLDDPDDDDPFVDGGRGPATAAAIVRALREGDDDDDAAPPAGGGVRVRVLLSLPLPADADAAWQREAVAVCRLLGARVARRLATVRRQLAILERPPPSSRARFRQREPRGSPYKSSPLASR